MNEGMNIEGKKKNLEKSSITAAKYEKMNIKEKLKKINRFLPSNQGKNSNTIFSSLIVNSKQSKRRAKSTFLNLKV